MGNCAKPPSLTADEARRLGDRRWLVEKGVWSVATARQWLTRQTCLRHIEAPGYKFPEPERR